ncbi:MAG: hypothetical protein QNJ98_15780 [Planctomycetota bacterium]|nr:hypothetical protein [Planctomycetota bacterium]
MIVNEEYASGPSAGDADLGPHAPGQSAKAWRLAAVLAHEKVHVNQNGKFPVKYDHQGKLKEHFEYPAWCAMVKYLCNGIKSLKTALSDTKGDSNAKKMAKQIANLKASIKKLQEDKKSAKEIKGLLKVGTKREDVPPQYRDPPRRRARSQLSAPAAFATLDDLNPISESPLGNADGPYVTVGGITLRVADALSSAQLWGTASVEGLGTGETWAIGITPKLQGAYDDQDLVLNSYGPSDSSSPAEQFKAMMLWNSLGQVGLNRITLFVWPSGTTVDFANPDYSTSTRLDIDDFELTDSTVATSAGLTLDVPQLTFAPGEAFSPTLSGAPLGQYTLTAQWHYVSNGVLSFGTATTLASGAFDASGTAVPACTFPAWPTSGAWVPAVRITLSSAGDDAILDVIANDGDLQNPTGPVIGIAGGDDQEFWISPPSIRCALGAQQCDLGVGFGGLDSGWNVRVYATRLENGSYSDSNRVQLTSGAVEATGPEMLTLTLPCQYTDGQLYRLTGLAWPPGVAPTLANYALATRWDVEDVAPIYKSDVAGQGEFFVASDEGWAHRGEVLSILVGSEDTGREADVVLSWDSATEGSFGASSSIGPSIHLDAGGDFREVDFTLPTVSATTVVRLTITVTSPTGEFAPMVKRTAVVVYPVDAP